MVRRLTFAALSICAVIVVSEWGLFGGEYPPWLLVGLVLGLWFLFFRWCSEGRFSDLLAGVEHEAPEIAWPDRRQVVSATVLGIAFIAAGAVALACFDSLVSLGLSWNHG
ncbi:hypothetical protein Pla123a_04400 [Posidoniimonas polymericola]|uniref:Preprotein translocase subunit SecE n=1 Tax=Posidoniimonas polymericola TaxID=2528002 RepID=A0A5C5ZGE1_9BACT|nr:preprotein translocase subunit SecE [Posidoniimonas polymericola]TWT85633.1 hypothetical protein Pla123a_04400 [Posidoniimonas polymericola]